MTHQPRLTVKGQVTIPKDIREALGLEAGQRVAFELDGFGHVRISKATDDRDIEARKAEIMQRLRKVQADFKSVAEVTGQDMDGLAYQRWLRGDEFNE
ncbi:MAG TPA: AbrB/MazE/SpoVT family DNA-binding domain-containing protein [Novosphingobium sp.]